MTIIPTFTFTASDTCARPDQASLNTKLAYIQSSKFQIDPTQVCLTLTGTFDLK